MKTKILTLLAVGIIALLTTSCAYACLIVDPPDTDYRYLDVEFTSVTITEKPDVQNTARIKVAITRDHSTINVKISNAFPNYEATIEYTIENTGRYTVQFTSPSIENPNSEAIKVMTTDNKDETLYPHQTLQGTAKLLILPTALENTQYTFQVTNAAEPKEPSVSHNLRFWTGQIQACLGKTNPSDISPSTLEEYLDEISCQSGILKFSGTPNQKFRKALSVLEASGNIKTTLKAELLVLWLNLLAGWTDSLNNQAAKQLIHAAEDVLQGRKKADNEACQIIYDKFTSLT